MRPTPGDPPPKVIECPFTVIVDSRESIPYTFLDIRTNADQGYAPVRVPTRREALATGDYAVFGHPDFVVERKSKADLYSSISQGRDNFEARLRRMTQLWGSAVVVEAELSEILLDPPPFTRFHPKALARTVQAWSLRFPTHWWFLPGREIAETWTFRLLERHWKDRNLSHEDYRREERVAADELLGITAAPDDAGEVATTIATSATTTTVGQAGLSFGPPEPVASGEGA